MVTTVPPDWPVAKLINRLRYDRSDLVERYHIARLGVFGSYVRNEQNATSDLDVLVDFRNPPSLFTLVALQDDLEKRLGLPVDVVLASSLKPHIGQRIIREVIDI